MVLSLQHDGGEQQQRWFNFFCHFFYTAKISGPNRLILRSLKSDGGKEGEASR